MAHRERKVRTPPILAEIVANGHALSKKFGRDGECNRKYTAALPLKGRKAMVKSCGKSARHAIVR